MQEINVKVKLFSKKQEVKTQADMFGNTVYEVKIKSAPEKGKANEELIELLAKHFNVAKSDIKIKSGHTSRNKVVLIPEV